MRFAILILMCFHMHSGFAQHSKSDLKKHNREIGKSIKKGCAIWSLDTIFNSGKAVCLAEKTNQLLWVYDVSVKSLDGEELIYIKRDSYTPPGAEDAQFWHLWTFFPGMEQMEMHFKGLDKIAEFIVENDLVSTTGLNGESVNRVVAAQGMPLSDLRKNQTIIRTGGTGSSGMVERNRNGMIFIAGNTIKQSNVVIGTIKENTDWMSGKAEKEILVYLPDGTLVARATSSGITSHDWRVMVLQNGQSYAVTGSVADDKKPIVSFLVEHYYL